MAGWKQWQIGDAWTAADANSYLSHQVVPRFTTVANRDSAISSPTVGQMAWCDDMKELYIRSAATSTWVSAIPRTYVKPSDTSRASTTTFSADPFFTGIPLEASSYYVAKMCFFLDGDSAGDFKQSATYTGTLTTNSLNAIFADTSNTATNNTNLHLDSITWLAGCFVGTFTGNQSILFGTSRLSVSTAGNFGIQWAQGSSNVTATILRAGSFISLRKVK